MRIEISLVQVNNFYFDCEYINKKKMELEKKREER